jgi:hypothetical protein
VFKPNWGLGAVAHRHAKQTHWSICLISFRFLVQNAAMQPLHQVLTSPTVQTSHSPEKQQYVQQPPKDGARDNGGKDKDQSDLAIPRGRKGIQLTLPNWPLALHILQGPPEVAPHIPGLQRVAAG